MILFTSLLSRMYYRCANTMYLLDVRFHGLSPIDVDLPFIRHHAAVFVEHSVLPCHFKKSVAKLGGNWINHG